MSENYSDMSKGFESSSFPLLIVTDQESVNQVVHESLVESGFPVSTCGPGSIAAMLEETAPRLALVCHSDHASDHIEAVKDVQPDLPILALSEGATFNCVLDLIRAGAWDFVQMPCASGDIVERLQSLAMLKCESSTSQTQMEGLKGLCRRLSESNRELSRRFAELEHELASCQDDVDAQLDVASTVSAFQALLSQELGIEGVLQTSLEFILGKTGPTNAAIFLADSPTSYSLGAYVNYDCPREKADPVLRKFAADICHHVAEPNDLVRFQDVDAFIEAVGSDAEILESADIIGMPCCCDDECLAVVFLFRPSDEEYSEDLAPILDALRDALAEQLATIVNIHHRIADHWPDESTDESSDWGFGTGGNKAA